VGCGCRAALRDVAATDVASGGWAPATAMLLGKGWKRTEEN